MSTRPILALAPRCVATRLVVLAALVAAGVCATRATLTASQEDASAPAIGLITLYQHDAVTSSLDFRTGRHGGQVFDGEVQLGAAQLVYGAFTPGQLSFGFGADEAVNVVDLGPAIVEPARLAQDAALKFPISVFDTLSASGRRLVFQPAGSGTLVRLNGGNEVFAVPQRGLSSFEPKVGHCYAIRYQRTRGDRSDNLGKFYVVEHRPGESVTLRFAHIGAL